MRITRVTARRVMRTDQFETVQMEAEATVVAGENPDQVAFDLIQWVEDQIGMPEARRLTAPGEGKQ